MYHLDFYPCACHCLPDLSPLFAGNRRQYQMASKSLLRRWITVQWLSHLSKFGLRFIIYLVFLKFSSLVHHILEDIFLFFKHDVHYILLLGLLLSTLLLPLLLPLPPNISHHSSTKVKMDSWQTIKTQKAESATAGCAACIFHTRKTKDNGLYILKTLTLWDTIVWGQHEI